MGNTFDYLADLGSVDVNRGGSEAFVYKGEGRRVRGRQRDARYNQQLIEAIRLVDDVLSGSRRAALAFEEAMTTSDFPELFADIIDRQVLAKFREWPSNWTAIARETTVRDFRQAKLYLPNTGATGELDQVDQLEEYPEASVSEQTPQTYQVHKYGRTLGISWETLINDDLDMFRDLPERLAIAARRTEDRNAVRLYVDANGPHASLYTVGNANIVNLTNSGAAPAGENWGTNPPLSIDALQQAMVVLSKQRDEDGEPIYLETVTLVVPPALEVTAQNILNATQLEIGTVGQGLNAAAAREVRMLVANWMNRKVKLQVVPYIPMIATGAEGNSSWFLFGSPADATREALRMIFLRGHREPELFMKSPNATRVGGGSVNATDGDFENDGIWYKVRHVLGTLRTTGGHRTTVASDGTGS